MKSPKQSKKLLGIIGGMGPLADTEFISVLRRLTNASCDREHIPILYDGYCKRPDRSDFIIGNSRRNPYKSLLHSLKFLERSGADVIVMPCNTAHAWIRPLTKAKKSSTVFIDITYASALACLGEKMKNVCLLATPGTYRADVYGEQFFRLGIDPVYPDRDTARAVRSLILRIKSGECVSLDQIEPKLEGIQCDGFLLACTELSVALKNTVTPHFKYVDSLTALAEKAVGCFKKGIKEQ